MKGQSPEVPRWMRDHIVMRDVEFGFVHEVCPECGLESEDIIFVATMRPEAGFEGDGLRWCPCGAVYMVSYEAECECCGQRIREVLPLIAADSPEAYDRASHGF